MAKILREVTDSYNDEEIGDLFKKLEEIKNRIIEFEEIVRSFSDRKKVLIEKNMRESFTFLIKKKWSY